MLSQSMRLGGESLGVSVEILRIVSEIYVYVISAQMRYCKMNQNHPFLEQTYLNIALFNRSLQKFSESKMMWLRLESLQKEMYGENHHLLQFTWKNLGICFLGLGLNS